MKDNGETRIGEFVMAKLEDVNVWAFVFTGIKLCFRIQSTRMSITKQSESKVTDDVHSLGYLSNKIDWAVKGCYPWKKQGRCTTNMLMGKVVLL